MNSKCVGVTYSFSGESANFSGIGCIGEVAGWGTGVDPKIVVSGYTKTGVGSCTCMPGWFTDLSGDSNSSEYSSSSFYYSSIYYSTISSAGLSGGVSGGRDSDASGKTAEATCGICKFAVSAASLASVASGIVAILTILSGASLKTPYSSSAGPGSALASSAVI